MKKEFDERLKEVIDERLKHVLEDQGFIKNIGVEFLEFGPGYAKGRLKLKGEVLNPMGAAHGGCIFALADTIGGTAAITRGSYVTTVSASIDYLRSAKDVEYIYAQASEVKNGRTISVYDVMIKDDKDTNIARVTLSYYKLGDI
jgi:acyl-CoA thioesterase